MLPRKPVRLTADSGSRATGKMEARRKVLRVRDRVGEQEDGLRLAVHDGIDDQIIPI